MSRPGSSILVVDDEPGTVRVLAAVLGDAGYVVETASDGQIALELLATSTYEIVLVDYLMPQLDGAETLRAIRRSRALAHLPVVMMSGVAESIIRRRCRVAYDAFLRKPFGLDELLETVSALACPHASRRGKAPRPRKAKSGAARTKRGRSTRAH